jgi:hypothetical protein
MRTHVAALALAVAGGVGCSCPPNLIPIDGQAEFSRIIWKDAFGRKDAPPLIEWMRPNCENGKGFIRDGGVCVLGTYERGDDFIQAAFPPDFETIAHEFAHVLQYRAGMSKGHVAPFFAPDEKPLPGGPVDLAIRAVKAAGFAR